MCKHGVIYLISGSIPLKFVIKKIRIIYLQDILKRKENSLLHKFFITQYNSRKKCDWSRKVIIMGALNTRELHFKGAHVFHR